MKTAAAQLADVVDTETTTSFYVDWDRCATMFVLLGLVVGVGGMLYLALKVWPDLRRKWKREWKSRKAAVPPTPVYHAPVEGVWKPTSADRALALMRQVQFLQVALKLMLLAIPLGVVLLLLAPPWVANWNDSSLGLGFWWDRPVGNSRVHVDMARWFAQIAAWIIGSATVFWLLILYTGHQNEALTNALADMALDNMSTPFEAPPEVPARAVPPPIPPRKV